MMMVAMLSIALSSYVTIFVNAADTAVMTVDQLVVADYMGLWYEVYTDDKVSSTFEKDGFCVTAFYRERDNGYISVRCIIFIFMYEYEC
jgi:lipocalin